jgi:hypothetical protein
LYLTQFSSGKLIFYGRVLRSPEFVALVRKTADDITIEIIIISNKLTNHFAGLVKGCLGPDMDCGPSVGNGL